MKSINVVYDVRNKKTIPVNLDQIIKSRALFQANSGGGKSYLLRKFLEASHGLVQQIIIDPEGEFATLRELDDNDYLLVSKDSQADIQIDTRYAPLLAKKLMETRANVILDLYEMNPFERIRFVKVFVDALVNLPKKLWHPCMIVIDEIHTFAPESSKGRSESLESVASLASRGRKRGYALIGATQKLSKFHKDVAAELNTKFTGRCVLDIDQKRAAAELGISDYRELRNLDHEFWAFGPAISHDPIKVKSFPVTTTHEDIGSIISYKIANPEKIKKLRENFVELPQQAEEELKTVADYQKKIFSLEQELKSSKLQVKSVMSETLNIEDLHKQYVKGFNDASTQSKRKIDEKIKEIKQIFLNTISHLNEFPKTIDAVISKDGMKLEMNSPVSAGFKSVVSKQYLDDNTWVSKKVFFDGEKKLKDGAMRMLKAGAQFHPKHITRNQMGTLSGISASSTTFSTYINELKKNGWVRESDGLVKLTDDGLTNAGHVEPLPTDTNTLVSMWSGKFKAGCAKMLQVTVEVYPNEIDRNELAERSGITTPTTFSTYINELKKNGLVDTYDGKVKASKELFPFG